MVAVINTSSNSFFVNIKGQLESSAVRFGAYLFIASNILQTSDKGFFSDAVRCTVRTFSKGLSIHFKMATKWRKMNRNVQNWPSVGVNLYLSWKCEGKEPWKLKNLNQRMLLVHKNVLMHKIKWKRKLWDLLYGNMNIQE